MITALFLSALLSLETPAEAGDTVVQPLEINRRWDVLQRPRTERDRRRAFQRLAELLDSEDSMMLAGVEITPALLSELAKTPLSEPLVRAVREKLRRPFDLLDLLLFLDDVAAAPKEARAKGIWVAGGRARSEGIMVHPDGVYKKRPRRYAKRHSTLAVDKPARPDQLKPADDGDPLGPRWSARFENPSDRSALEKALEQAAPDFRRRVAALLSQLEEQGADVYLTSTVRRPERGYLMWGAFFLSRSESLAMLEKRVKLLEQLNGEWDLNIPIVWRHPEGLQATQEAARQMSDAYDVVYATKRGARYSDHYDGSAVDFVALALPRALTLIAPNGTKKTFNLSHPSQPRDVSLTPRLVVWIEKHFGLRKLLSDYPHWNDAKGR